MTAWANFYDYILPEVNSATPGVVDRLLREIAIDFCERSCILTEEADLIDVVANTATYTLVPLSEAGGSPPGLVEPYKVKAAWFDNTPLNIATVDALNSFSSYWGADTAVEATAYSQKVPSEIILYPKPTQSLTNGLRVELIVRPTMGSTGLADWVAERYMECLAYGVKGRLMAQPNRPWTNPEYSSYYTGLYNAARSKAAIEANNSLMRSALSVRQRPAA
jgi:hypothetical protein